MIESDSLAAAVNNTRQQRQQTVCVSLITTRYILITCSRRAFDVDLLV